MQRQRRKLVERSPQVEHFRIGVHVIGEFARGVPHEHLPGSQRYTRRRQQRIERGPKTVNVEGSAATITLRNAALAVLPLESRQSCRHHVPVENLHEPIRHVEHRRIIGKPRRDRPRIAFSGPLYAVFQSGNVTLTARRPERDTKSAFLAFLATIRGVSAMPNCTLTCCRMISPLPCARNRRGQHLQERVLLAA